ncbi:hypothetical protein GCM10017559_68000 [Streptosporangium longisporum]|uniref:Uncharacterized protein n=1 Tax=Streptosporangium longisporum TaxID=46187 RepID=A0ABP6L8H4_9ACTN
MVQDPRLPARGVTRPHVAPPSRLAPPPRAAFPPRPAPRLAAPRPFRTRPVSGPRTFPRARPRAAVPGASGDVR